MRAPGTLTSILSSLLRTSGMALVAVALIALPADALAGRGGYTDVPTAKVKKPKKKKSTRKSSAPVAAAPAADAMDREKMMAALSGDAMLTAPGFELSSPVVARDPDVAASMMLANMSADDPRVWRQLGSNLVKKTAFDDAVRAFVIAVDLDPSDPDARVDLGAVLVRSGETKKGKNQLKAALKLEPFHALAYYNLGIAHQQSGDYDEAIDAFKTALRIDPDLGDPSKNPSAATNVDLPYAKLEMYRETQGRASTVLTADTPE